MFQHTVDRADRLAAPGQRVMVVGAHHEEEATRQLQTRGGRLVLQPANRDTAAGIYLPLTYVRAMDPDATVAIYPSDHFIHPEEAFIETMRHAAMAVDIWKDRLVLLGMRPHANEFDYGYIKLDRQLGRYGDHSFWTVNQFLEKPDLKTAQALGDDVLWNTMIMVAKVETLWKLGTQVLPSLMRLFETFQPAIDTPRELQVLGRLYDRMPVRNFSSDLLERVPAQVTAMEVNGVEWSDWGRAGRIADSLHRIGKTPVFPAELAGVA